MQTAGGVSAVCRLAVETLPRLSDVLPEMPDAAPAPPNPPQHEPVGPTGSTDTSNVTAQAREEGRTAPWC